MNTEISQERIKRFWKWCGFKEVFGQETWRFERYKETNHWWEAPNGQRFVDCPPVDLNNLFKWAVPKLDDWRILKDKDGVLAWAYTKDHMDNHWHNDPAIALFLAIEKLIEEAQ